MPRKKNVSYEHIANFLRSQSNPLSTSEIDVQMVATAWKNPVSRPTVYRLLKDKVLASSYGIVELPMGSGQWTYDKRAIEQFQQRGFELYGEMPINRGNMDMAQKISEATRHLQTVMTGVQKLDPVTQQVVDAFEKLRVEYASETKLLANLKTAQSESMGLSVILSVLASDSAPLIAKRIACLTYALYGSE